MKYFEYEEKINLHIRNNDFQSMLLLWEKIEEDSTSDKELQVFSTIIRVLQVENDMAIKGLLWQEEYANVDALIELYYKIKYALRRMEYGIEPVDENELLECKISGVMLWMMTSLFTTDKKRVLSKLLELYEGNGRDEVTFILKKALEG